MLTASVPFHGNNTYLVDDTPSTLAVSESTTPYEYDLEQVAMVASLAEYLAYIRLVYEGEASLSASLLLQQ